MAKSKVPRRPRGWKLPILTAAPVVGRFPSGTVGISTLPKLDQQSGTASTVLTSPPCTAVQLDQTTSNHHFCAHQLPQIRPPPPLTIGSTQIRPPPPLTIGSTKKPSACADNSVKVIPITTVTIPVSVVSTTAVTFTVPFSVGFFTTTTPTTTPVLTSSTAFFSQLEEILTKWYVSLNEQEKTCLAQVNVFDICRSRLLSNNEKMVALNDSIDKLRRDGARFQLELDYIRAQQHDKEGMRIPLEERLKQEADIKPIEAERKHTYQLIGDICAQIVHFTESMKKITDELNAINIQCETMANSYAQVARVFDDQERQWIETNCASLQRKLALLLPK